MTEASGASVVVPPGALGADVAIRIAKDSTGAPALPAGLTAAGATYVITPHGGDFAQPVEVRIPAPGVTLQPNQELKLAKAQPGGEWLVLGDSELKDGVLSAQVGSFSFFVPVTVTYLLPLAQQAPLQVSASLDCGDQSCGAAIGTVTATYTVTTNSGALPARLRQRQPDGSRMAYGSSFQRLRHRAGRPSRSAAASREPHARPTAATPTTSSSAFAATTTPPASATEVRHLADLAERTPDSTSWRPAAQLDVVEAWARASRWCSSGGASADRTRSTCTSTAPTRTDRAVVDWQRSDDGGASWRTIARSYQDEANPEPGRHGCLAGATGASATASSPRPPTRAR